MYSVAGSASDGRRGNTGLSDMSRKASLVKLTYEVLREVSKFDLSFIAFKSSTEMLIMIVSESELGVDPSVSV